jgi:NADPH-dependent curcumin reductase CurA
VLAAEYPQGVDIVYEGVGGAVRAAIMPHLAPGARLLQVGYISGAAAEQLLTMSNSLHRLHGLQWSLNELAMVVYQSCRLAPVQQWRTCATALV